MVAWHTYTFVFVMIVLLGAPRVYANKREPGAQVLDNTRLLGLRSTDIARPELHRIDGEPALPSLPIDEPSSTVLRGLGMVALGPTDLYDALTELGVPREDLETQGKRDPEKLRTALLRVLSNSVQGASLGAVGGRLRLMRCAAGSSVEDWWSCIGWKGAFDRDAAHTDSMERLETLIDQTPLLAILDLVSQMSDQEVTSLSAIYRARLMAILSEGEVSDEEQEQLERLFRVFSLDASALAPVEKKISSANERLRGDANLKNAIENWEQLGPKEVEAVLRGVTRIISKELGMKPPTLYYSNLSDCSTSEGGRTVGATKFIVNGCRSKGAHAMLITVAHEIGHLYRVQIGTRLEEVFTKTAKAMEDNDGVQLKRILSDPNLAFFLSAEIGKRQNLYGHAEEVPLSEHLGQQEEAWARWFASRITALVDSPDELVEKQLIDGFGMGRSREQVQEVARTILQTRSDLETLSRRTQIDLAEAFTAPKMLTQDARRLLPMFSSQTRASYLADRLDKAADVLNASLPSIFAEHGVDPQKWKDYPIELRVKVLRRVKKQTLFAVRTNVEAEDLDRASPSPHFDVSPHYVNEAFLRDLGALLDPSEAIRLAVIDELETVSQQLNTDLRYAWIAETVRDIANREESYAANSDSLSVEVQRGVMTGETALLQEVGLQARFASRIATPDVMSSKH